MPPRGAAQEDALESGLLGPAGPAASSGGSIQGASALDAHFSGRQPPPRGAGVGDASGRGIERQVLLLFRKQFTLKRRAWKWTCECRCSRLLPLRVLAA